MDSIAQSLFLRPSLKSK